MNTVLVLFVSVTVCWHLVLCTADQDSSASYKHDHVDARSEESFIQRKDIAALLSATRDFMSVMKRIKIERGTNSIIEGRGMHGMMKIAVPLIAGFKVAAMVVSSLVILKGLLLKSLAFSSLAATVSMGIAFKYLYDKIQGPLGGHGGNSYDPQSLYNSYAQSWSGGSDQVWQGSSAVELQPGLQGIQGGHEVYPLTGGADLQGHFSEHIQKIANTSRLPFGEQMPYLAGSSSVDTPYQPPQYSHAAAQYPIPHGQRNL